MSQSVHITLITIIISADTTSVRMTMPVSTEHALTALRMSARRKDDSTYTSASATKGNHVSDMNSDRTNGSVRAP